MEDFFNSLLYQWIIFLLTIVTFLSLIVAVLLIKHRKKLKYVTVISDGGCIERIGHLEKKSNKYWNTGWCQFLERISKIL